MVSYVNICVHKDCQIYNNICLKLCRLFLKGIPLSLICLSFLPEILQHFIHQILLSEILLPLNSVRPETLHPLFFQSVLAETLHPFIHHYFLPEILHLLIHHSCLLETLHSLIHQTLLLTMLLPFINLFVQPESQTLIYQTFISKILHLLFSQCILAVTHNPLIHHPSLLPQTFHPLILQSVVPETIHLLSHHYFLLEIINSRIHQAVLVETLHPLICQCLLPEIYFNYHDQHSRILILI